ncbi:calcium/sodium antiporter [Thermodesulfobacteriota bacterium]
MSYFVVGLFMLYFGAGWLVKGSSSLASSLGLTPLVIGITIVAFGTSAPELFISVVSSIKNKSMIALGNVIGSNICNIALVLGVTALFHPVTGSRSVIQRDIPVMLGISLYLLVLSLNSTIGRLEGVTLFSGIILFTYYNLFVANRERTIVSHRVRMESVPDTGEIEYVTSRPKQLALILVGIAGVVLGADILVDAAVKFMKVLGVNEKFVGLTVVAFGTSVPELATSVVAAVKKEMDISIGNLIGSNVFNMLSVLGAASIVRPIQIPGGFVQSGLLIDYLVMMGISFLPLLLMKKDNTVQRIEGLLLLVCYVGYVAYLVAKT